MNLIRKAGFSLVALVVAAFARHELNHFYCFGHFVPLGLHVEVVVRTSNDLLGVEGTGKIYNASVTNYGILPASVTVCDYLDWASRHQVMVNYIVERPTPQIRSWQFVPEWDDYGSRLYCRPSFEVTETHRVRRKLWPSRTYRVGEGIPAQWGGFHVGTKVGSQYFPMGITTRPARFLPRFSEWTKNRKVDAPQVPITGLSEVATNASLIRSSRFQ
jgi:hypothetical protein